MFCKGVREAAGVAGKTKNQRVGHLPAVKRKVETPRRELKESHRIAKNTTMAKSRKGGQRKTRKRKKKEVAKAKGLCREADDKQKRSAELFGGKKRESKRGIEVLLREVISSTSFSGGGTYEQRKARRSRKKRSFCLKLRQSGV